MFEAAKNVARSPFSKCSSEGCCVVAPGEGGREGA